MTPTYPKAAAEHGNDCGAPRTLCLPLSQTQGVPIVNSTKQDRYYMKLECRRHLSTGAVPPTERYEVIEGAHCPVATSSFDFAKLHIHVGQLAGYRTLVGYSLCYNSSDISIHSDSASHPLGHSEGRCTLTQDGERFVESVNEFVCVVDDDSRVREALTSLLRAHGKSVRSFDSGHEFLEEAQWDTVACLILDMRMPGMSGLEVQEQVINNSHASIVFITGRNDVPSTVLAMKGGAVDFLTKPVSEDALLRAVDTAIAKTRAQRREAAEAAALRALYETLTPREQELLPLLVGGMLNKQAADILGITEYTVQVHRGHIMKKMQAGSFAALVRQASRLGLETHQPAGGG